MQSVIMQNNDIGAGRVRFFHILQPHNFPIYLQLTQSLNLRHGLALYPKQSQFIGQHLTRKSPRLNNIISYELPIDCYLEG